MCLGSAVGGYCFQAAFLVLLATAAGAGIVAADFRPLAHQRHGGVAVPVMMIVPTAVGMVVFMGMCVLENRRARG